jgi:hypothetical protein
MATFPLMDFVLASLIMGLGIGADVCVATMIRAKHLTTLKAVLFWIVGVCFSFDRRFNVSFGWQRGEFIAYHLLRIFRF